MNMEIDQETLDHIRKAAQSVKGWWVISALRGPDFPDPISRLKRMTTAVVRYFVGLEFGGVDVLSPEDAKFEWVRMLPRQRNSVAKSYCIPENWHFRAHIIQALTYLGPKAVDYMKWWTAEVESTFENMERPEDAWGNHRDKEFSRHE